jgi:hypothetical protein
MCRSSMTRNEIKKIRELMGDVYNVEKVKGVKKAIIKAIEEQENDRENDERDKEDAPPERRCAD